MLGPILGGRYENNNNNNTSMARILFSTSCVNQCGLYTHLLSLGNDTNIYLIPIFLKAAPVPAIYHSAVSDLLRITFEKVIIR